MTTEPESSPYRAHTVACHCAGQGSDETCPTRWNGSVGATNCAILKRHKGHEWFGHHPYRFAVARMRCRGVTWRDVLRRPRENEHSSGGDS